MAMIEIKDLGKIEVDDNFFKLSPKEQNEFVDQAVIQDAIDGSGRAFMTGMLFNFRDEIVAALSEPKSFIGSFTDEAAGKDYRKELSRQRLLEEAFRRKNPAAAIASEIAGGVLVPGAAIGQAAKGASLLSKLMRTSGAGAGMGAIAGTGAGTDADSRVQKAGEYGVAGAVLAPVVAAAVPVAGKIAAPIVRTAGRLTEAGIAEPSIRAARMVARRLKDAGITGDALEALKRDPKPMALADISSRGVQSLARLVAQSPGKGAELADSLNVRQFGDDAIDGAAKRIEQDLVSAGVPKQNALEAKAGIDQIKSAGATQAYNKSNAFEVTEALRNQLKPVFSRPSMKGIIAEAKALAAENGEKFSGTTLQNIDMKGLDYVQRRLRARTSSAYNSGDGMMGGAIAKTREELVNILDNANDDFRQARGLYSDAMSRQEALALGRKFKTMKSEGEIADATKGFGADEMHNFRVGMAQSIRDDIEGAKDGADFASRIAGNQRQLRQLKEAFPAENIAPLEEALAKESQMAATRNRTLFGSQTVQTSAESAKAAAEDLTMARRAVEGAKQGGLVGGVAQSVGPMLESAAMGIGPRTSKQLGDLLFSTDPASRAAAISRVQQARGLGGRALARGPVLPQQPKIPSLASRIAGEVGRATSGAVPRGLLYSTGQQVGPQITSAINPISSAQASSIEDMAAGGNIIGYETVTDRLGERVTYAKTDNGRYIRVN